jgi:hypothetical protein
MLPLEVVDPGQLTHSVVVIVVSDRKGLNQPACQEEWKKCRKKRRTEMPM